MSERYQPDHDSQHGCCWGACVRDTQNIVFGKPAAICECDDFETAQRIANALNKADDNA